jgi:hypothetical protein
MAKSGAILEGAGADIGATEIRNAAASWRTVVVRMHLR